MRPFLLCLCALSLPPALSFAPGGSPSVRATTRAAARRDPAPPRAPAAPATAARGAASFLPSSSSLRAAAAGDEEESLVGRAAREKKLASRRQRVEIGYGVAAASYAFFTVAALVKYRLGYVANYIAVGTLLPAGIAYILGGAATHDRLASDTYKRLNLALGAYALVDLAAKDIVTTFHAGWVAACVVALVNAAKGFGYGVWGWELDKAPIIPEFVGGAKSALASAATPPPNLRVAGYQAATWAFTGWKLSTLWNLATVAKSGGGGRELLPLAFQFKKLLLLQATSFTLKDAAGRGRLGGTTFVQLNLLNAVASGILAAYYYLHRSCRVGGMCLALNTVFCAFGGFFPETKGARKAAGKAAE